jgi:5-methylcytosine-specific restriction endonuclease McrA
MVISELPFTIRLKERIGGETQPIQCKIDPGSKTTGIALVREEIGNPANQIVIFFAELQHRSQVIHKHMTQRAQFRRRRRSANLRYRPKRFLNRKTRKLPPSLQSRVDNITTQILRFKKIAPITSIHIEDVRFDTQVMQNQDIDAVEYQRGTLYGFEIREYLLEKWGRKCAYCDAKDIPLNLDHIMPKSKGGSDRPSNLVLACVNCNQSKGSKSIHQFLSKDAQRISSILSHTKISLKDAAAVNTTRKEVVKKVKELGLPTYTASGGRTKFNRTSFGLPKTHCLDAACVGDVLDLQKTNRPVLRIEATGRGSYQRTRLDSYGFPRGYLIRKKRVFGFQTGDRVFASVPEGKKRGTYTGRVAVRSSGFFNIQTNTGVVQGISWKYCQLKSRANGYNYSLITNNSKKERRFLPPLKEWVSAPSIG